ncbi:membrane protease YdiL (CAAX protease family) [Bradyrhizobium sp. i1.4.4]
MDSLNPDLPPMTVTPAAPRVWKFWGTAVWGLLIFVAMFVGQIGAILYLACDRGDPLDLMSIQRVGREPAALALSVTMGLPATLAAVWLAIRIKKASFVDYLALHWPSWKQMLFGAIGLVLIVVAWETMSRSLGREATPGFMTDLLKSGRDKGAAVMLLFAFSVAAPMSEEVLARGLPVSRLVGELPARARRDHPVVTGVDGRAPAVRHVLPRGGLLHRPVVRLHALSRQLALAHHRAACAEQSDCGGADDVAGELRPRMRPKPPARSRSAS